MFILHLSNWNESVSLVPLVSFFKSILFVISIALRLYVLLCWGFWPVHKSCQIKSFQKISDSSLYQILQEIKHAVKGITE